MWLQEDSLPAPYHTPKQTGREAAENDSKEKWER